MRELSITELGFVAGGDGDGDDGGISASDVSDASCSVASTVSGIGCVGDVCTNEGTITITITGESIAASPNFADALVGAMASAGFSSGAGAVVTGIALGLGVTVALPVTATIAVLAGVIGVVTAFTLANYARGGQPDPNYNEP